MEILPHYDHLTNLERAMALYYNAIACSHPLNAWHWVNLFLAAEAGEL